MKAIFDRLRRWFKVRFAVVYPVVIYLAFFGNLTDQSLPPGLGLIIIGAFIRLWANCYAIKMGRLTTSGPYAFVRNPLYLGTAIIMVGMAVLLSVSWWLSLLFFAIIVVAYYRTIVVEQRMLTEKFGKDYIEYMQQVPVMIPRFTPYNKGEKWMFSWQRLLDSREHKVLIWLLVAVVIFSLKAQLVTEKEPLGSKGISLIVVAVLLALTDLCVDIVRNRLKRIAR